MESPPQVLVIIPLYNARPYVRAAIESILSQSYSNFILLIINDGSTDGGELDAASFRDSRVILWNQENQGLCATLNRATQYALDHQIPYFARMDADDISLSKRLQTQISLLEKYPLTVACSANSHYIDAETGKIIGSSTVSASPSLIKWEISHGLRGLIHGACVFRTTTLADVGGYRLHFKHAEDMDLFLRLAEKYELRNCTGYLYQIRIRSSSLSLQNSHKNILYQFYALDCAQNRRKGKSEQDYAGFLHTLTWNTKLRIWREEYLLNSWRVHIHQGGLSALLIASLLDPRRVLIRGLRKLDERKR